MKETALLFSAPMVQALLDDSKSQTRRIMRDQVCDPGIVRMAGPGYCEIVNEHGVKIPGFHCPYGAPGDRLWVKETFFAWGRWETRFDEKKKRDAWHFLDMTRECNKDYLYAADGVSNTQAFIKRRSDTSPMYWRRPSIFMPSAVSRITLEITGVRVERLNDISEADSIAEGISEVNTMRFIGGARYCYSELWNMINGEGSWDLNPWVWVIEFKRVLP